MKRLLIDSSSIVQGALHAAVNSENATMVTFEEKDVSIPSAIDGYEIFLTSLEKTLDTLNMVPMQIVLVKDGKNSRSLRREFLPGYKNRPAKPPEFMEQFNIMQDRVEATLLSYGAISVEKEGYEADDLLAALAAVTDHVIWSKDGDLLAAGDWYFDGWLNPDKFFGIQKQHIVVYKSLVGDTSDKIPGAAGFGKVGFIDMVAKFGDEGLQDIKDMLETRQLHELEAYVSEFKPFQKILDSIETVYNSYDAARFHHPGFSGLNWKAAYPKGNGDLPKWNATEELVTRANLKPLNFKGSPYVSLDIETAVGPESLAWSERNKGKTDKTGPLDVFGSKLTGFSLTYGNNCQHTKYFSFDHKDTDNLSEEEVISLLNSIPQNVPTVVHNSSFELCVLRNHFELKFDRGYLPPTLHDTRIMAGFIDEYESPGLKHNSKLRLEYTQASYDDVTQGRPMNELTGEEVVRYGCDDTICTSALYSLFTLVMAYESTWDAYEKCAQKAQFIYAESFLTGTKFDLEKLKELQDANSDQYALLELELKKYLANIEGYPGCEFEPALDLSAQEIKRVYTQVTGETLKSTMRRVEKLGELIGGDLGDALIDVEDVTKFNEVAAGMFVANPEINLRSPKQMSALLYDYLGFPVRLRNKLTDPQRRQGLTQGNPASNGSAIAHAIMYDADEDQKVFLKTLIDAKSCLTEDSLFYEPYQSMPSWIDGYVHPQSGQAMAKSGRANASKPNFQQVSKKSRVREVYVPLEDDHIWVSFDFSSQELVHIAVQSQDKNMLDCYRGDVRKDVHSLTGVQVLKNTQDIDLSYDEFLVVLKDEEHPLYKKVKTARNQAKATNFLDAYMGTAITLAEALLITEELAQKMLDGKAEAFPDVKKWQESMSAVHLERGYAVEPMGRRRHLRLDGSWKDKHELRGGLNHIIQGGAGSQLTLVLSKLWDRKVLERYHAYFLFSVYDEVNFSVAKSDVVEFIKEVHPIMVENYCNFPVEFESSIEIGPNFGELKSIGTQFDEAKIKELIC